jgi:putative phosphotransacetylase
MKILIEISARHIHLLPEHFEKLFGEGYELKPFKELSQPGQFAAEETLEIIGPRSSIAGVRVMGPCRDHTQVEISKTDARALGIDAPVRLSSEVVGSAPVTIKGPKGEITLEHGAIIAQRHIHLDPKTAESMGLNHKDAVDLKVEGERALIFKNVAIRIEENFSPAMHIDTDEGNAAGISPDNCEGEILV